MEIRGNGNRFNNYYKWEIVKNQPYDYAKHGLLRHIMSPTIVDTTNPILKVLLQYVESSFVFVMKYIDILKNFKNIHWKNR
jgi:hypothetical protein